MFCWLFCGLWCLDMLHLKWTLGIVSGHDSLPQSFVAAWFMPHATCVAWWFYWCSKCMLIAARLVLVAYWLVGSTASMPLLHEWCMIGLLQKYCSTWNQCAMPSCKVEHHDWNWLGSQPVSHVTLLQVTCLTFMAAWSRALHFGMVWTRFWLVIPLWYVCYEFCLVHWLVLVHCFWLSSCRSWSASCFSKFMAWWLNNTICHQIEALRHPCTKSLKDQFWRLGKGFRV